MTDLPSIAGDIRASALMLCTSNAAGERMGCGQIALSESW